MEVDMTLAERIRNIRTSRGMSQEAFAELVNVSRQAVSMWECGRKAPHLMNIMRLGQVLGMTIEEITGQKKPEAPAQASDTIDNSFSNTGTITGHNVGNVLITGAQCNSVPDWLENLLTLRRTNRALFKLLATDATDEEIRTMAASLNTQGNRHDL